MADDLNEILKHNPFKKELVDGWKETLSRIAEEKNFGGNMHQNEFFAPRTYHPCGLPEDRCHFILPGDNKFISDCRIATHYIPQPFIGHPSAPVWILNENPSPFGCDVCAMLNVSETAKQLQWTRMKNYKPVVANI